MNCDICHENFEFNSYLELNNLRGGQVRVFICPDCRKKYL
jgi:uncharacterized protein YlaI